MQVTRLGLRGTSMQMYGDFTRSPQVFTDTEVWNRITAATPNTWSRITGDDAPTWRRVTDGSR